MEQGPPAPPCSLLHKGCSSHSAWPPGLTCRTSVHRRRSTAHLGQTMSHEHRLRGHTGCEPSPAARHQFTSFRASAPGKQEKHLVPSGCSTDGSHRWLQGCYYCSFSYCPRGIAAGATLPPVSQFPQALSRLAHTLNCGPRLLQPQCHPSKSANCSSSLRVRQLRHLGHEGPGRHSAATL